VSDFDTVPDETTNTGSRRERRKQEMRSRICDAAIALFGDRGCDNTTVEDICEQADVARKTFYNYFTSKQQLLQELSEALLYGETTNLIDLAMERYVATPQRLAFFFARIQSNLDKYDALERVLVLQSIHNIALDDGQAGRQLAFINAGFARLYEDGLSRGEFSAEYSVDFLAELTVGAMNAIVLNWVHQPGYPVAERVDQLLKLLGQILSIGEH
jgi:AcrR family transcriptional regulator